MVLEFPAVERKEEFLVVDSPRSTCTPSSVSSQSQVFTFPSDDAIEAGTEMQQQEVQE